MTEVSLPHIAARIDADSHILLLGSCFADEVGQRLTALYGDEHVCSNPMGVLYNPASIALVINASINPLDPIRGCTVFLGRDGLYHSWLGSSKVSGKTADECVEKVQEGLSLNWEQLDTLIITLGTDRCYRRFENHLVVANCHKELASTFEEVETDGRELEHTLQTLLAAFPRLQVVMTVSPYRYRKYGLHESQLSKARLLLMVDHWCRLWPDRVAYFPAYEIVLDELRDYSFYKSDMLHPSSEAADIVFHRFLQSVQ